MIIRLKRKAFIISIIIPVIVCAVVFTGINSVDVLSEQNGIRLPIIMYHQLTVSESRAGKYVLTVDEFENDLNYLKNNGYETVTVNQVIEYSLGNGNLPEKPVMLTFDDGCETLYAYALPLLQKYGYSAVGFVVGALADTYSENDDHNLNYSCLNWSEIKELCDGNVIDIQSHSYDLHKNTAERSGIKMKKNETLEEYIAFLTEDATKMKEKMVENTGKAPVAFAYPFGSYSDVSADILKKNGIKMVLTCEERVNIIKKAEPDILFRLGRYNRPNGISSGSFFEKMGNG